MKLAHNDVFLSESTAFYVCGSTAEVARTLFYPAAVEAEKDAKKAAANKKAFDDKREAYTRAVMGAINFERCVWPKERSYSTKDMETLSRQALWKAGLHFEHGTGHCHSAPIENFKDAKYTALKPGMCQACGPAYY